MRKYKIHHTDSFTNIMFGGNPTVTVLNADSLQEDEMRKIAREMNLSETGFVLNSKKADFSLRFFTPQGDEIKFCGHATVGALSTIVRESLFGCTQSFNHLKIETNAGLLKVEIDLSNLQSPLFIFDAPKIDLIQTHFTVHDIAEALSIPLDCLDKSKPVMLERTNNYLYLTARNLKCLGKIIPDMQKATKFAEKDKIVIFCFMTSETFDPINHIHARGFAPLVGVPEDPFTGSMQGGLAAYAMSQKILEPQKWIGVEQGHFIQRPGFVKLEVTQLEPMHVRLHAEAVPVFSSEIYLP
jgi:PhzF family phenazine biosynthesis protein